MPTLDEIKMQQQIVARLERRLALQKIKKRKAETRRKIELGGLVVKAQMDQYSKAIILGALLDALENLKRDKTYQTVYRSKGEAEFMGYEVK